MSLIPYLFSIDDDIIRPSRLFDQQFGLGLSPRGHWSDELSHLDAGGTVTATADKDKFQVCLDVQHFRPEEITVKTTDNYVTVEGKHEEKKDEHGFISRQFVRRYVLPEGHDSNDVVSSLSSDGVLTITAPRQVQGLEESERVVPITATGPVQRTLEHKNSKGDGKIAAKK